MNDIDDQRRANGEPMDSSARERDVPGELLAQGLLSVWLRRCPSCDRFLAMRTTGEVTDGLGVRLRRQACGRCGFERETVVWLPPGSVGGPRSSE